MLVRSLRLMVERLGCKKTRNIHVQLYMYIARHAYSVHTCTNRKTVLILTIHVSQCLCGTGYPVIRMQLNTVNRASFIKTVHVLNLKSNDLKYMYM